MARGGCWAQGSYRAKSVSWGLLERLAVAWFVVAAQGAVDCSANLLGAVVCRAVFEDRR